MGAEGYSSGHKQETATKRNYHAPFLWGVNGHPYHLYHSERQATQGARYALDNGRKRDGRADHALVLIRLPNAAVLLAIPLAPDRCMGSGWHYLLGSEAARLTTPWVG